MDIIKVFSLQNRDCLSQWRLLASAIPTSHTLSYCANSLLTHSASVVSARLHERFHASLHHRRIPPVNERGGSGVVVAISGGNSARSGRGVAYWFPACIKGFVDSIQRIFAVIFVHNWWSFNACLLHHSIGIFSWVKISRDNTVMSTMIREESCSY